MHWKQREVLDYLCTVDQANLSEIYRNVTFSYYCNEHKHLGAILSRLVKSGHVTRIKPGLFQFIKKPLKANQPQLFNSNDKKTT